MSSLQWFVSSMRQSVIRNNEPLVYGVVGHPDRGSTDNAVLTLDAAAPSGGGMMLIDTGAQVSVLELELALEFGLPETAAPVAVIGLGGEREARQFTAILHLPEWDITMATTFVSLPLQEEHGVLALIGMDVLSGLILTLDGPRRRITLSLPS